MMWVNPNVLRLNYGQVVVNYGEPIALADVLAEQATDLEGKPVPVDEKPAWLSSTVDNLAQRIQVNINRAADVNPINLLALALLSTPKHAMGEGDLRAPIVLSKRMLEAVPYSELVTVTPHSPEEIIAHGEENGVLRRTAHPLGDVLSLSDADTAVLLRYFPNNVLTLFTASLRIARCFHHNRRVERPHLLHVGLTLNRT